MSNTSWEPSDPSINTVVNNRLFQTAVHLRDRLHLTHWTSDIAIGIHELLERVVFPSKDVVAVVTEAEIIAKTPDKGLRAILGPETLIIELCSVPYCFVHELWHSNWVRVWTRAVRLKGAISRVRHVAHVVLRVQVLAVPASWKSDIHHDARPTRILREIPRLRVASSRCFQTGIGKLPEFQRLLTSASVGISYEHAESRLKCSNLGIPLRIHKAILHVINGCAAD